MRQARSILLIVWIAAIAALSHTTDGLIAGRIVDAQTGQPIAATQVSYLNLQTNTRGVADAGSSGFYALPLLPPGAYRIRATADGYQEQEVHELELSVAGRVDLNLKLRPLGDVWEQGRYRSVFFPDSEAVLTFFGPDVDASRVGTFEATEGNQAALESTVSQVIDPAQIRELPLLSHHKSNRVSWLEGWSGGSWESRPSNTCKMGVFSKTVTLRICRIRERLASMPSCFFRIATIR